MTLPIFLMQFAGAVLRVLCYRERTRKNRPRGMPEDPRVPVHAVGALRFAHVAILKGRFAARWPPLTAIDRRLFLRSPP
jgi:hypothetical protein